MLSKKNLPPGIYVNHEYPIHIKHARDKLQPILQLAKSIPHYRDKSKLEEDHLVINGISYTLNDLAKLSPDLAAYKAAEKSNEETIVFQGELSPWLNFHNAPFIINDQKFKTSEHWIQFQKALLFSDTTTADTILRSDMPYKANRLGYQVKGVDNKKWLEEGYQLCLDGVKAKFHQNLDLLNILKTTYPKLLAEETTDRMWGTSIHLRDSHTLDRSRWHSNGWLSDMLMTIRDEG